MQTALVDDELWEERGVTVIRAAGGSTTDAC